jgi:hypothetical protein
MIISFKDIGGGFLYLCESSGTGAGEGCHSAGQCGSAKTVEANKFFLGICNLNC